MDIDLASKNAGSNDKLNQVKNVDIDPSGTFKYILIKVTDKTTGDYKYIVRGYASCPYHADIFDTVEPDIKDLGLKLHCPGGGRIQHLPNKGFIKIYGYSQGYGQADHQISQALIKGAYPDYSDISYSNEGY